MAADTCTSYSNLHADCASELRRHHCSWLSYPSADLHYLGRGHPYLAKRQARPCRLLGIFCPAGRWTLQFDC